MNSKLTGRVMKTLEDTLTAIKAERNLTADERKKAANTARQEIQRAFSEMPTTDSGERLSSGAQPATGFLNDVYGLLQSAEMEGAKFPHFDRLDTIRESLTATVAA